MLTLLHTAWWTANSRFTIDTTRSRPSQCRWATQMPTLQDLPDDVWLHIAAGLAPRSLTSLQVVCKRWSQVVLGEDLLALWMWQRAWSSHPEYNPAILERLTRGTPMPSMALAERLCTWAGHNMSLHGEQEQNGQLVLGVTAVLWQWLVTGLVQQQHGLALLSWILQHEENLLQHRADHPRRLLRNAIQEACVCSRPLMVRALLGCSPEQVLQLAALPAEQVILAAVKGGSCDLLSYLLQHLQAASRAGSKEALVHEAAVAAARAGNKHLLDMLQQDWGMKPHSEACTAAVAVAAAGGHLHVMPSLTGCTCTWAAQLTSASTPATVGTASTVLPAKSSAPAPTAATAAAASDSPSSAAATATASPPHSEQADSPPAVWVAESDCPALLHPLPTSVLRMACKHPVLARSTDVPVLHMLLAHQPPLPEDADELIAWAARVGHVEILQLLLACPQSRPCIERGAAGAALLAAMMQGHLLAMQLLLSCDGISDSYPATVSGAASNGNSKALFCLLSHPPAAMQADAVKWGDVLGTALMMATLNQQLSCMETLLRHGADASWHDGMCLFSALGRSSMPAVKVLLKWGAVSSEQVWGKALRQVAGVGNAEMLQQLLIQVGLQPSSMPTTAPTDNSNDGIPTLYVRPSSLQVHLAAALQECSQAGHVQAGQLVMTTWQHMREEAEQSQGLLARDIFQQATAVAEACASALVQAASKGHVSMCAWLMDQLLSETLPLLDHQARVEQFKNAAMPALQAAADTGHEAVLGQLLSHGLVQLQSEHNTRAGLQAAVLAAARQGHTNCVRTLLSAGADPTASTLYLLVKDDAVAHVKTLLMGACALQSEKNRQLQLHDPWLWPPETLDEALCVAAEAGSEECVQLLVQDWGACVDAFNGAPLQAAVLDGNYKVVRRLLALGADCAFISKEQFKALADKGWVDVAQLLKGQKAGFSGLASPMARYTAAGQKATQVLMLQ